MSPNGEESRIRELFNEMRLDDERAASPFHSVWAAARERTERSGAGWRVFRLATATALVSVIALAAFIFFNRPPADQFAEQIAPVRLPSTGKPSTDEPLPHNESTAVVKTVVKRSPKRTRWTGRPLHSHSRTQMAVSITEWRSPTTSLLKWPGDELLKKLPRLDQSVLEIKSVLNNPAN